MLTPKKVKFRKSMKGNLAGTAYTGSDISFGDRTVAARCCSYGHLRDIAGLDGCLYLGIEICSRLTRIDLDDQRETNRALMWIFDRTRLPPAGHGMHGEKIASGKI